MIFAFDDLEIDLERIEVRRAGEPVAVEPQVFDVIEHLLRHRDRVVPKEELLDEVWSDRFVTESALTSRVKSARRALGDDGATQRVIRTAHGRGYRFVAEVELRDGAMGGGDRSSRVGSSGPPSPRLVAADPGTAGSRTEGAGADGSGASRGRWARIGRAAVEHRLADALAGGRGAVVTGPDRIGRSAVLRAVADEHEARHAPVLRVAGAAADPAIALSGFAGLLGADVVPRDVATASLPDDLGRTAAWRHARAALVDLASSLGGPARPPVLAVDDADRLDGPSRVLLADVVAAGEALPLVAVRAGADDDLLASARAGRLELAVLGPLDDADVDAALFRRLAGPVEPATLSTLVEVSGGVPGVLVDVVDASLEAGALVDDGGVWRLVGHPVSPTAGRWPPPGLTERATSAAGLLVLAGSVPLVLAADLVGEEALDELDDSGLVRLADRGDSPWVALADPLLERAVEQGVTPLRRRRHAAALAELARSRPVPPGVLAALVEADPDGGEPTAEQRRAAAIEALVAGEPAVAERLVAGLDAERDPVAGLVAARVALRRGQHERAAVALGRVDADRLDGAPLELALRQRASIDFAHEDRRDDVLTWLSAEAAARPGDVGGGLLATLASLLVADHRYDEVLALAERAGPLEGHAQVELDLAVAWVEAGRGRFEGALEATGRTLGSLVDLDPIHAEELLDGALVLRCTAAHQLGRIAEAADLARRRSPPGRVARLGFFPAVAADAELHAGRPRAALEILRSARTAWLRRRYPQFTGVVEAVAARCEASLGRADAARRHLGAARRLLAGSTGAARSRNVTWSLELAADLGGDVAPLRDEAEAAVARTARHGAALAELEVRCALAASDPSGDAARVHLERVRQVGAAFDGDLWPLRVAEVVALAEGRPRVDLAERYRALGYVRHAERSERR